MFLDTNVLVYARFQGAPFHRAARGCLDAAVNGEERACLSWQVIREYLAVVTRTQSWAIPLSMGNAMKDVTLFSSLFHVLQGGPEVMAKLKLLAGNIPFAGQQVHDANIVATMMAHNETRLLTFNDKDFFRYRDHIELMDMTL